MADTRARRSWRPLLGAALLCALWVVCLVALRELFVGDAWTWRALGSAGAVVLVAGAVRTTLPAYRTAAWALGVVAGAGLLVWWLAQEGRLAAWLREPLRLIQETWLAVSEGVPPVELTGPLLDVVLSVWFVGLALSSLLLTRFGMFFASGIVPALLMLAPVTVTSLRVPAPQLLWSGALLLLLLWAGAPRAAGRWRGIAAAGMALALAAGLIAALPPSQDRIWNSAAVTVSPVSSSVPDVTIALARDLQERSETVAFDYRSTESDQPVRFTLAVLSDFERGTWLPEDELGAADDTVETPRGAGPDTESAGAEPTGAAPSITVRTKGLLSAWLPLPQGVERVEAVGGSFDPSRWIWVDGTATARSDTALTRPGDEYRAITETRAFGEFWQPEQLSPEQEESFDPERYLALPEGAPAAIAEAAREVTAPLDLGATALWDPGQGPTASEISSGSYVEVHVTDGTVVWTSEEPRGMSSDARQGLGTASLLEAWFRSGEFVYDERAPYEPGADPDDPYAVMEAFLEQRSGYCVHFASTYAVMARSLGLPSRVAVGYASRPASNAGWTSVRARELHAWPEVHIDGLGWIAFEPTPGGAGYRAETGQPYRAEDAPTPDLSALVDTRDPSVQTDDQPESAEEPEELAGDGVAAGESGDSGAPGPLGLGIPLAALGLILGLLCIAPGVRLGRRLRRRRRIGRDEDPAAQAWAELVDTAVDLGLYLPAEGAARARTPEAVAEHLAGRGLLSDGAAAARTLARAVVEELYSGAAGGASPRDPGSLVAAADLAIGSLRSRAGWRARFRAAVLPRSVIGR
ncbi:transglutaminase-like domain-containing protein [Leucobacter celer]|uniref:transglutaminase-like domain-containing protein n=1 Tax=Leucobacter celer TaxID=668625 RepID=UPI0006A7F0AF|nr:transglutaminase-like domain-containing protein [Leucobacter celer]